VFAAFGILVALIPIFQGALAGQAIGAVIAALTLQQWAGIAGAIAGFAVAELEPSTQTQIDALLKSHPVLVQLIADVEKLGPQKAAANAKDNAARTAFGFEDPANPGMF